MSGRGPCANKRVCFASFHSTATGAIGALTVPALFDRLRHRRGGRIKWGKLDAAARHRLELSIWLGGFLRHEEIYRDGEGRSKRQRKGPAYSRTPAPTLSHRSEFPPAIPRRVAPQQSPPPLRWLSNYTFCSIEFQLFGRCFRMEAGF
jgi:hypothetical protein